MIEKIKEIIKALQMKQIGVLLTFRMLFLGLVLFSWLYGYWSNGIYGTHFEINSCWQGLGGIVAGLGGVATLAGSQYAKYYLDSRYNSEEGKHPNEKEEIKNA